MLACTGRGIKLDLNGGGGCDCMSQESFEEHRVTDQRTNTPVKIAAGGRYRCHSVLACTLALRKVFIISVLQQSLPFCKVDHAEYLRMLLKLTRSGFREKV